MDRDPSTANLVDITQRRTGDSETQTLQVNEAGCWENGTIGPGGDYGKPDSPATLEDIQIQRFKFENSMCAPSSSQNAVISP